MTLLKYFKSSVLFLFLAVFFIGCKERPSHPIVIIYENDVHCQTDGYAKLAALRNRQQELTPYVTTVSCGDFIQGNILGTVSQGENIVKIMNKVQYDIVTLGNHEFDFGIAQLFLLTQKLNATVVSANFRDLRAKELPFPAYKIIRYGSVKIAYIGFTTTSTTESVASKTFQDNSGNPAYDFSADFFYENAQHYIDKARAEGADYVVGLSHLGNSEANRHPGSISLINHTTGIDVLLDGHDHCTIPDTLINNREGKPVLLSSTGSEFAYIGVLTLSTDGRFSSRLVSANTENQNIDKDIQTFVTNIKEQVLANGQRVIGTNRTNLSIYDDSGKRIVRNRETNIGNFCADAFRIVLHTDVAMINGGGIRNGLPPKEITYNDLISVFPFNNSVCTATLTGQQLSDALEFSVKSLPEEDGDFMQVSGIKFEVSPSIPTSVERDNNNLFSHVGNSRRISRLMILNKNGQYEPIDPGKKYTIASFDYQLKKLGSAGILRYAILKEENLGQDVEILSTYIKDFLGGNIGHNYAYTDDRIIIR